MRWTLGLVVLLGACITEEEYNGVVAERDAMRSRVATLEDEVDQAKGRIKELEKELAKSRKTQPVRPPEVQIAAAYSQLKLQKGGQLGATFDTSMGEIECKLFPNIAPQTVLNFVGLAEGTKEWIDPESGEKTTKKLYDGTKFHRVIDGFMIQGGDPLGTGRGGPGYKFADEIWPDVRFDRPGLLAMANSGADTNGSQFFITVGRPVHLNGRHTIFGHCELETVAEIAKVEVGGADGSTPTKDVVIKGVQVIRTAPEE